MSVYTVIVDGYNVKFSREGTVVGVSIPGYRCDTDTGEFSEEFIEKLKKRGWKSKAIKKLQNYIFGNEWNDCIEMDIKTGNITRC